jgi:hypothetical protein
MELRKAFSFVTVRRYRMYLRPFRLPSHQPSFDSNTGNSDSPGGCFSPIDDRHQGFGSLSSYGRHIRLHVFRCLEKCLPTAPMKTEMGSFSARVYRLYHCMVEF